MDGLQIIAGVAAEFVPERRAGADVYLQKHWGSVLGTAEKIVTAEAAPVALKKQALRCLEAWVSLSVLDNSENVGLHALLLGCYRDPAVVDAATQCVCRFLEHTIYADLATGSDVERIRSLLPRFFASATMKFVESLVASAGTAEIAPTFRIEVLFCTGEHYSALVLHVS